MPTLNREKILWSLEHIVAHGDTDIFPYPFEFEFFNAKKEAIVQSLAEMNTATYRPLSPVESLVPKSKNGFRIAHQLYPVDAVMLTTATVTLGDAIEATRNTVANHPGFSYRYRPDVEYHMFSPQCRYSDWLQQQNIKSIFSDDEEYSFVIEADIADFYQRLYHHRLENSLLEVTGSATTETRFIMSMLRDIRARQSFGLPVGGNAARLLAELAILDIDRALTAEGYEFTRYVDDFRIFIKKDQDPYSALAFLANSLWSGEGLSLSTSKTKIITYKQYKENLQSLSGEDNEQAEAAAAEQWIAALYDAEDSDEALAALAALKSLDAVKEIREETSKEFWDIGKIRILLRLMKLTKDPESVGYIKSELHNLLPFAKEIVLLMEEMKAEGGAIFEDMEVGIVDLLLHPSVRHMPVTRSWLLEVFAREIVPISSGNLRRIENLNHILDIRSVLRIKNLNREIHYFRGMKTRVNEFAPWMQPAFLISASCLPAEEYRTWLGNIRGALHFPLSGIFVDWLRER